MKVTVRRSYLHRRVQTVALQMRDDEDPQHAIDEHAAAFDNDLVMFGQILDEHDIAVVDQELELEIVGRETQAQVIQFPRRDP